MKKMLVAGCGLLLACSAMAVEIKSGDKIAWLGDSITYEAFANARDGFMNVTHRAFASNGLDVVCGRAGVPGNTSRQMLARMKQSVLDRDPNEADFKWLKDPIGGRDKFKRMPTHMVLCCGVNDVQAQKFDENGKYVKGGVLLPEFKENVKKMIEMAQENGIKVIVMTQTMPREDFKHIFNKVMVDYNNYLREIAKAKGCTLVDVDPVMRKYVADFQAKAKPNAKGQYPNCWSRDGLHPNGRGHRMMGELILKEAFGFTPEQIAKERGK